MKNKSRQAKGRYLQNLVKDRIIKLYPLLTNKDIRTSQCVDNLNNQKLSTKIMKTDKQLPYQDDLNSQF